MGNLKGILAKKMKQLGIDRQVEAAGVVEAAQKEIAKYIPKEDFEVISFKGDTLKILTKSPAVSSEIFLNKTKIIEKITSIKKIKTVNK